MIHRFRQFRTAAGPLHAAGKLVLLALCGALLTGVYHAGILLPIWASVALLGGMSVLVAVDSWRRRIGPLLTLLFVVYALPFMHLLPYLWYDFSAPPPPSLWGIVVNPYMIDEDVIKLMGMIGAAGAIGLVLGVVAANEVTRPPRPGPVAVARSSTLPVFMFVFWLLAAIALSWLAAPEETVFTSAYTAAGTRATQANFYSAALVSYTLIVLAVVDSLFEPSLRVARTKRRLIFATLVVVVGYLQILRGDRESFPLVVAVLLLYVVWGQPLPGGSRLSSRKVWTYIGVGGITLLLVSYLVGAIRSQVEGVASARDLRNTMATLSAEGAVGMDNLLTGTWSAVLLTPLSVAGDDLAGSLALRRGTTYRDYVLSLMPGMVANAIGFKRPIDAENGPAWEMRYGLGGTHATVVPFLNFRLGGVVAIIALWAFILQVSERALRSRLSLSRLSFVASIACCCPLWLWYGEKYVMNAVIIWAAATVAHRVLADYFVGVSPQPRAPAKPWHHRG